MSDSLIQRQPELLTSAKMPARLFREQEKPGVGEYTADRFYAQRPDDYHRVVQLLAEGVGIIRIARSLKVSEHTVIAVRNREGAPIAMEKKALSDACHSVARLALEGVTEDLADPARRRLVSTGTKAMIAGIAIDKGQLLAGEATSRLEVTPSAPPEHDDYLRFLQAIPIGGTVETPATKGGPATSSPPAAQAPPAALDPAPADVQSVAPAAQTPAPQGPTK